MRLLLKLIICISTLTLCIISCQEKSNINFIGDISEGFCQAKKLNRKVLLIVGAKDCGKCSKFVEYISEDAKIRKSLENDFVVVYEGNTDNNIGAKLTRCFAMPMPYVFKNNGQLISFGYPQKNKTFSDTLGVGMDDMGYLELFNLSISQVEYKAMVSKSVQSFFESYRYYIKNRKFKECL